MMQEADNLVLRIVIITKGQSKGRQRFVTQGRVNQGQTERSEPERLDHKHEKYSGKT